MDSAQLENRHHKEPPGIHWKMLLSGGISNSCGQTVAHPIDVMKVRLQLDNELTHDSTNQRRYNGMVRGFRTFMLQEGNMAVWNGWRAAMLREMLFGGLRFTFYEPIKYQLGGTDKASTPVVTKLVSAAAAGSTSAAMVTPTDVVKTRLQAQETGKAVRHNGCLLAFRDIYRSGGLRALYTGWGPNTLRAMVGTCAQITSYDHTKHTLLNAGLMQEGVALHVLSSFVAGLNNAIVTTPIDLARIRIMNQSTEGIERKYKSVADALVKTAKAEGLLCLYKGFIPVWMRITPHTIITFAVFEQLRIGLDISPV